MTKIWYILLIVCFFTRGTIPVFGQQKKILQDIREVGPVNESKNTDIEIHKCFTTEYDAWLLNRYPSLESRKEFEAGLWEKWAEEQTYQARTSQTQEEIVYVIPVIVHVVHNGEPIGTGPNISFDQVMSQIDVLNEDYRRIGNGFNDHLDGADIKVEFKPAIWGPDGIQLDESGVNRVDGGRISWDTFDDVEDILKPSTIWDPYRYLNIWVTNFGGELVGLLGYAQYPYNTGLDGPATGDIAETDGVIINYQAFGTIGGDLFSSYNLGRTTTHEIGHFLGLLHPWGVEISNPDCSDDDYCGDTPKTDGPNNACTPNNSCIEDPDLPDMIENYMDYTPDNCMNIFTLDQKFRMRTVMEVSPRRKELLVSTVHLTEGAIFADFNVDKLIACTGEAIIFTDLSVGDPTHWMWYLLDTLTTVIDTSNQQNFTYSFNTPGIYSVVLTIQNLNGKDSLVRENIFRILAGDNLMVNATGYVDSLDDQSNWLKDWLVLNPNEDNGFTRSDASAYGIGEGSVYINNHNGNSDGYMDSLISPSFDFSLAEYPYLIFDKAYALYNDNYGDTLQILYSTDCGNTYNMLHQESGSGMATTGNTQLFFIPTANEWTTDTLDLSSLTGMSGVHLAFINISGRSNNLYFDNIRIVDIPPPLRAISMFAADTTMICAGASIQFSDQSENNPLSWEWIFEGGVPTTSQEQNPTVIYNQPGQFTVTLSAANDQGGDTLVLENYVNIYDHPDLVVPTDSLRVCLGDLLTVFPEGADSYSWLNKDYLEISNEDTLRIFPVSDQKIYVTGYSAFGCSTSDSIHVFINQLPETRIVEGDTSRCDGILLGLTAVGAKDYTWYTLNNDTLGTGNVLYNLPDSSLNVVLKGMGQNGCMQNDTAYIQVYPIPEYDLSVLLDKLCYGDSVEISLVTENQVEWYVNNQYIGSESLLTYPVYDTTQISVRIVSEHNCIVEKDLDLGILNYAPEIEIEASTDTICLGEGVVFNGMGGSEYKWYTNEMDILSNENVLTLTPDSSGWLFLYGEDEFQCRNIDSIWYFVNHDIPNTLIEQLDTAICPGEEVLLLATGASEYVWLNSLDDELSTIDSLRLTVLNDTALYLNSFSESGCAKWDTISLVVTEDIPTPEIVSRIDIVCLGSDVFFQASGAESFRWLSESDSLLSHSDSVRLTPDRSSNIILESTSFSGCKTWTHVSYVVNSLPVLEFSGQKNGYCPEDTLRIVASGATTYIWTNPLDAVKSTKDTLIIYDLIDSIYYVEGQSEYGCRSNDSVYLSIYPELIPILDKESVNLSLDIDGNLTWYFLDEKLGKEVAENVKSYTVIDSGYYFVMVVDTNGCKVFSDTLEVLTGQDMLLHQAINVYPNPVSHELVIEWPELKITTGEIFLLDLSGRILFEKHIGNLPSREHQIIDMRPFKEGMYLLRIHIDREDYTFKIIKREL